MADEAKEIRRLRKTRQRELQRAMQMRRQTRGQAGEAPPKQAAEETLPAGSKSAKPKLKDADITGLKSFDKLALDGTRSAACYYAISGLKHFDKSGPLLERLQDDACQRDKAGNRLLHFDQYCLLISHHLTPITAACRSTSCHSDIPDTGLPMQKPLNLPSAIVVPNTIGFAPLDFPVNSATSECDRGRGTDYA